jgi:hypothetical protein
MLETRKRARVKSVRSENCTEIERRLLSARFVHTTPSAGSSH